MCDYIYNNSPSLSETAAQNPSPAFPSCCSSFKTSEICRCTYDLKVRGKNE